MVQPNSSRLDLSSWIQIHLSHLPSPGQLGALASIADKHGFVDSIARQPKSDGYYHVRDVRHICLHHEDSSYRFDGHDHTHCPSSHGMMLPE